MGKPGKETGMPPGFILHDSAGEERGFAFPVGEATHPDRPGQTGIVFSGSATDPEAAASLIEGMGGALPPGELEIIDPVSQQGVRETTSGKTYGFSNWNKSKWRPEGPQREVNRSSQKPTMN